MGRDAMSKDDTISEKLHAFAEKVEDDFREREAEHEKARHERDKEIEHEKKRFEKHQSTVGDADLLALEDEDIVTDD